MITNILTTSKSDDGLNKLMEKAREYAHIYALARQRHKGCEGTGELMTLKEEFRDVVDKMIQYCQEKKYITENILYDIDSIADEIERLQGDVFT